MSRMLSILMAVAITVVVVATTAQSRPETPSAVAWPGKEASVHDTPWD